MNKYILTALLTIFLISIGQILFKLGANTFDSRYEIINISQILNMVRNKYLIFAVFIYILSTILWIYTLSKLELSYGYILMSLSFPIILILSSIVLHEEISFYKIISVSLIVLANIILIMGENG